MGERMRAGENMTETMTTYYRIEMKGKQALSLESEIRRTILRHSHLERLLSVGGDVAAQAILGKGTPSDATRILIGSGVFDVLYSTSRKVRREGFLCTPVYELELVITGTPYDFLEVEQMLKDASITEARGVTRAVWIADTTERGSKELGGYSHTIASMVSRYAVKGEQEIRMVRHAGQNCTCADRACDRYDVQMRFYGDVQSILGLRRVVTQIEDDIRLEHESIVFE